MNGKRIFLTLVIAIIFGGTAFSQWMDGEGGSPINPNSGEVLNPSFAYDPADGIFYIENAGPNGIVDSMDNLTLLGDDIGLISLIMPAPPGTTVDLLLNSPEGSIAWAWPVVFNNKIQFSGNAVLDSFLPIQRRPIPLFQLTSGYGVDDFRDADGNVSMEVGVNFELGAPGGTLFSDGDAAASGAFRVLPEPSGPGMLLLAGISMLRFRRR